MSIPAKLLGDVRETLLAGRYSLFLGAGVNFGGKLRTGEDIPLGDQLRQQLVALKGLKANSSLARASSQLTQSEKDRYLTDAFSSCIPSPALLKLPQFFWRRVYTLNIDDALEAAYKASASLQAAEPRSHAAPYVEANDITVLQIAHIHGWSQRPDDGYVFSLAEYAGSMGPGNPWVNVLAHTLATEPFIVAGTSLEEPDLEYFLAGRSVHSVRTDRGPSFLIEPFPDAATERECARHGLTLYEGTFDAFLSDLLANFPDRPLPISAPSGLSKEHFTVTPKTKDLALFSRDFSFVVAHQVEENADLGFLVGREPTLDDIALGRDIPRQSTLALKSELRKRMTSKNWDVNFLVIDENAGAGKSTVLRRALYDLSAEGFVVFDYRSISTPDIDLCAKIFNSLKGPFIISCDDFADHVPAIVELYKNINRNDFLIIGCERSYRTNYVLQSLAGNASTRFTLSPFNVDEAKVLAQKLDDVGLASIPPRHIEVHAQDVSRDPIALAVCRILNNFRSANDIIGSLLRDADQARIQRYVASALAGYCYRVGLRYEILSSAFDAVDLQRQFNPRDILPLAYSNEGARDYVAPLNPILGEQVLRKVQELDGALVFDVYCAVGSYLASYVNREALRKRTPEARIASRMFDYDDVVSEFIPSRSEEFYLRMKRFWDWNSRYWEQLALLKLDRFLTYSKVADLSQAVSHAKHAIQIERHPLGLTTLGRILIEQMKHEVNFEPPFAEAFDHLDEAIRSEGNRNRITIHPYTTMFNGVAAYTQRGGIATGRQIERLKGHVEFAERQFYYDSGFLILVNATRKLIP